MKDDSRYGEGYNVALVDVGHWLRTVTNEWHELGVVSDSQALALKNLVHEFELAHLYTYIGGESDA